jgi:hypothetical protein
VHVILKQKPDGYTSKYYSVTVGKTYKVVDTRGSCFLIKDDEGEDATIACSRFEVVNGHEPAEN